MASSIVARIESRADRARSRRLAKLARAARPSRTSPAITQLASRLVEIRPAQAEFWKQYLAQGDGDSLEGFIPCIAGDKIPSVDPARRLA